MAPLFWSILCYILTWAPLDTPLLQDSAFPATKGLPQHSIFLIVFLCPIIDQIRSAPRPPPVVQPRDLIIVASTIKVCFPLYVFGVSSL